MNIDIDIDDYNRQLSGALPGFLGIKLLEVGQGFITAELTLDKHHLEPTRGVCHAATIVALADTACGWGCVAHLPSGASGFTTSNLTANYLRGAKNGTIHSDCRLSHGGRSTQVWDAVVTGEDGKNLALFRCTQMILY